jgi:transposase-like protein
MVAKIRRMYFRDKVPLREIARKTGISRNTLRHWLRQGEMREPGYPSRTSPSILDPYKDQLANWLRTDSHL